MCGIWAVFGCKDPSVQGCLNTVHRGPDAFRLERIHDNPLCFLGFHRLAIMDSQNGMQPFRVSAYPHIWVICNGEIYNFQELKKKFGFSCETGCDSEILLHLYNKGGAEFMAKQLDGVFGLCLVDTKAGKIFIGRDTFGVRPVFRYRTKGMMAVCSEAKGMLDVVPDGSKGCIEPVKPGTLEQYDINPDGFVTFQDTIVFNRIGQPPAYTTRIEPTGEKYRDVRELLIDAVRKRMMSQRRIGCMLSGGLDSSLIAGLVCQVAKELKLNYPIQTFAIGMPNSPDLIAAKKVADFLGTEHHEVTFTPEEGLAVIDKVIYSTESYDITVLRAAIGMYLLSQYIAEKTDSRVIFSGEGSDEVAQGYLYFRYQPSPEEGDKDSRRLLQDLYLFDVLRADRACAAHGLELRVPFLDHKFTSYVLSLPPDDRRPQGGIEKHLIREAFSNTNIIPREIVWRRKEGFSDGVSPEDSSWFTHLQKLADKKVSSNELEKAAVTFPLNPPFSKETYMYRDTFARMFPGCDHFTPYYWMPRWIPNASDPSGRKLDSYDEAKNVDGVATLCFNEVITNGHSE